jgi:hypothetical protein
VRGWACVAACVQVLANACALGAGPPLNAGASILPCRGSPCPGWAPLLLSPCPSRTCALLALLARRCPLCADVFFIKGPKWRLFMEATCGSHSSKWAQMAGRYGHLMLPDDDIM